MGKQLSKIPEIRDFTKMNIANSIIYYREAIKRETNLEKKEELQQRLNKLKIEIKENNAA